MAVSKALRRAMGFTGLVEGPIFRLPLWFSFFILCEVGFEVFMGFVGSGLWWCAEEAVSFRFPFPLYGSASVDMTASDMTRGRGFPCLVGA